MDSTRFGAYVEAFNDRRYDDMLAFYRPDVTLQLPASQVTGPTGIKDYYTALHARVSEELTISFLVADDRRLATELRTTFRCHRDLPGFSMKPLVAGEVLVCTNFVHYDLVDGAFHRIRVARYQIHS